ncbi:TetR/AcrR family transcriptional regulator [Paenibacillus anseongense]|uniref:TetR/AcrR family transcriptional regulator n=1 Tax=Paenibacillus anseongense TaxID=2682845 RepID=UPI002DB90848|nr:TetR/AcrR family transcriptional regulator [Paenibacillus anseongense]MEC0270445.1 TetR/AcrR family transcriptional regulator [Paenibacillus anseongense]
MDEHSKNIDRRIKRSLRLLKQSFLELMKEKKFASITIQDITDRADVNRSTFYAHFSDKYALLDLIIREHFQNLLTSKLPQPANLRKRNLRILIQIVLEHFEKIHKLCHPSETMSPLIKQAIQEEIAAILLSWFKQVPITEAEWQVPVKTTVLMISWAIFGVAIEWSQEKQTFSTEQMANQILTVITNGMAGLTPNGLLE